MPYIYIYTYIYHKVSILWAEGVWLINGILIFCCCHGTPHSFVLLHYVMAAGDFRDREGSLLEHRVHHHILHW